MHKNIIFGAAWLAASASSRGIALPSLDFQDIENQLPPIIDQPVDEVAQATAIVTEQSEAIELEDLSTAANEAEALVYEKLKAKVNAETLHGTAQWAYSEDKSEENKLLLEETSEVLYLAKNELASAKQDAKVARIAYSKMVAKIGADDELSMTGLDTGDNGTGIPGGLDEIGVDAAALFLPGHRLTASELKLQLEKLKFQYTKRKVAINAWKAKRITEADDTYLDKKNLEVLKKRTQQRLKNGKQKTDTYRKAVKTLLKDYYNRYQNRQLNKFQWDQIREWATGKFSLSKERYNAFKERIINKYKSVLERTQMARESKRKQKTKAKALAQEQQRKNRETYELAKKRLLLQGRVRGDSVFSARAGTVSFDGLPNLMTLGDDGPLDPIGGLDPFGDDNGIDDDFNL